LSNHIQLIVGLANPGPEYTNTRHNAGAWYIEQLANWHNTSLKAESKFFGQTARINIDGHDVRLLVPTTFMNCSGKAVAAMTKFYQIPVENILVAHDELDLEPGIAKFKQGGGHGGHNGLRDIISSMSNNKNFHRLRIAIGHPGHKDKVTGYVLGKAPKIQQDLIDGAIDEAVRSTSLIYSSGFDGAKNRLHTYKG
jgi:PTH1 family peptidyl-tRNA hydrolase